MSRQNIIRSQRECLILQRGWAVLRLGGDVEDLEEEHLKQVNAKSKGKRKNINGYFGFNLKVLEQNVIEEEDTPLVG